MENELFISKSIDLNLFFMRITEEHLIFIQSVLTPNDICLINQATLLRNEALKFLAYIQSISCEYISNSSINSNELLTKFTYDTERVTEKYTGINIDSNLTLKQLNILQNRNIICKPISKMQMYKLNSYAIDITNRINNFLKQILKDILDCKLFLNFFPDRIDHIIEENNNYLSNLQKLQNMKLIYTIEDIIEEVMFWNENMEDHAEFLSHLLDPKEEALIKLSLEYAKDFERLSAETKNAVNNPMEIKEVVKKSLLTSLKFKEFNVQAIEDTLKCKVKALILPLAADHDLRELNHYIKILHENINK